MRQKTMMPTAALMISCFISPARFCRLDGATSCGKQTDSENHPRR